MAPLRDDRVWDQALELLESTVLMEGSFRGMDDGTHQCSRNPRPHDKTTNNRQESLLFSRSAAPRALSHLT
jgi:hypothetical protein